MILLSPAGPDSARAQPKRNMNSNGLPSRFVFGHPNGHWIESVER